MTAEKCIDQLFADPRDVLTDECMVEELYYSHIARHPYFVLNQSPTDLYGDPVSEPVYDRTIVMPIHIKLDPEEEELNRYGYDRTREVIILMSRKILYDNNLQPKVGDRIDFTYRNALGAVINEHLIINELSPVDFQRQLVDNYSFGAAGNRTHKLYQPNPPGTPTDPKVLPFDTECLRG